MRTQTIIFIIVAVAFLVLENGETSSVPTTRICLSKKCTTASFILATLS